MAPSVRSGGREAPGHPSSHTPRSSVRMSCRCRPAARVGNPLAGFDAEKLSNMGYTYCTSHGITDEEDVRAFRLGAVLAGYPEDYQTIEGLTDIERESAGKEITQKWKSIPTKLWFVVFVCSLCAAVQGMDETTVNGAQVFYKEAFGIANKDKLRDALILGLTNGAPYLCCALLGCWLTAPLNNWFGRRGTIFLSCLISAAACMGQALTNDWRDHVCCSSRPRSRYRSQVSYDAHVRRRMVGFAVDLAFYQVADENLKWRLMLGSTTVPALIVCALAFLCPESPRHYMRKGKHMKAYQSMCKMRMTKVQAARDLFYANALLEVEARKVGNSGNKLAKLFKVRRNRNAMMLPSRHVMQHSAGVNIIAYYSAEIFIHEGFSVPTSLAVSLGWGTLNWLGAIPAIFTIDKFGRRRLLLITFPMMFACLLWTSFSFYFPSREVKIACVTIGTYLFAIVYSPGAGPVPFTYSAEVYPLDVRSLGMSIATATTWFFNFVLAFTFPMLRKAFTSTGAFSWYAAWNLVGFFLTLFFVRETKEKTLEELDGVFDVPVKEFFKFGVAELSYFGRRCLLMNVDAPTPPYRQLVVSDGQPMDEVPVPSSKA
ncbi:proton myo-inositol cotransporter [Verticillium alfalfae VaMs.102]|uniref:Proton myo-inositol cotransporter n=1 Tax=Verticillium alfalfae (strain VaMs.102 / ATCC MYA-4576 / FGSC 10136) TaxID=526221 RepID=C9SKG1_VERA1|nr:proton myo-inositol cotransporter [Verticillium alfalfae VaMs.102]EEY19179.1 proton myo-inositol cotransporter [Verticillium alfalfae VaMs.102]